MGNITIYCLCIAFLFLQIGFLSSYESSVDLRNKLHDLLSAGNYKEILKQLKRVEDNFGTLIIDNGFPSLYLYKGVAYHGLHLLQDAETSFKEGLRYFPHEARAWINLGEIQTLLLKFNYSVESYEQAYRLGERTALARLLTAKGWVDSWENIELIAAEVEKDAYICMQMNQSCSIESAFGLEYTDIPVPISRHIHSFAPVTKNSLYTIHPETRAQISLFKKDIHRRLRVGVISSDFGVHPVSSLIRGVLHMIDKSRIELFCFSVTDAVSWWRYNLSQSVEHFDVLQGVNSQDGASIIASKRVDILIDLNGHTKNSGLPYLSHRPAPVQISFLGLPLTTSAQFIDYYIGDNIALPPEHRDHFSEKLILMQPCYIANDYAQLQGDVVRRFSRGNRASRKALAAVNKDISTATFLFGTISNSQKMDLTIFHVWMNVLRRYGGSILSWTQHTGMATAMINLCQYGEYFGIPSRRLVMTDQAPWLDHLYRKTSVDIFLDTSVKNGHTTGLDSIWSGVPTITLGGGSSMPTRAGESIANSLGNEIGVTYSLKEYEDLLFRFAESATNYDEDIISEFYILSSKAMRVDPLYPSGKLHHGYKLLRKWKHELQDLRTRSPLFDTKGWTQDFMSLMESTWEATNFAARKTEGLDRAIVTGSKEQKHFFSGVSISKKPSASRMDLKSRENDLEDLPEVASSFPLYHIFSISRSPASKLRDIQLSQGYDPDSEVFRGPSSNEAMNESLIIDSIEGSGYGLLSHSKISSATVNASEPTRYSKPRDNVNHLIFLNIGGIAKVDGWLNINTETNPFPGITTHTDYVRPLEDLWDFENASVSIVYACHSLEHSDLGNNGVRKTLSEWHRVLRPGGLLLVSVPDLRALARLYLDRSITTQERWTTTMMIYGSQVSAFDYHKVGFDEQLLHSFLHQAGFCDIERVASFNLFEDSSEMVYKGYRISLNMRAKKCATNSQDLNIESIELEINTSSFDRRTAY